LRLRLLTSFVLHSKRALGTIALEAATRLPRKDVPIVVRDAGEGLVPQAPDRLRALGDALGSPAGSISGKICYSMIQIVAPNWTLALTG
jgi:hypothetical protein